jgi:arginase family enzyme
LITVETRFPGPRLAAVRATGAETVYVHIDLDVLDPRVLPAVGTPEPGGSTSTACWERCGH